MEKIADNIKYLRKKSQIPQVQFAKDLEVGRTTVVNWEKGTNYPSLEMIVKVADYFSVTIDKLMRGDINNNYRDVSNADFISNNDSVPYRKKSKNLFVSVQAQAGYGEGMSQERLNELEPISIPGLPDNIEARTFEVSGMSMHPIIYEGDLLVCLRVERDDTFTDDEIYVIATRSNGLLVKFIRSVDPHLQLVSHNAAEFSPLNVALDDVIEIWRAKFKITRHFSSGFSTAAKTTDNDKIARLEEFIRQKFDDFQ